jgi:predicted metal-dependent HD superfamily phosphohydrolase
MDLLGSWLRHSRVLAPRVGRVEREVAGLALLARYDEPHRAYHDRRHLGEVIAAVALLADQAADPSAVMLAAWWHDAIYEIGSPDNEPASAELAAATLAGWDVDPDRSRHVTNLVRLTATHDPGPEDRSPDGADGRVLSDADLAILAAPAHRYGEYAADVRREYAAVPVAAFAAGRAAILGDLLGRERIYRTSPAYQHWEASARDNLGAELAELTELSRLSE